MSINFRDVLKEKLKDPDFKKEFEALEPEYSALRTIIEARKAQGRLGNREKNKEGDLRLKSIADSVCKSSYCCSQ